MADPSPHSDSDTSVAPDRGSATGASRWQKVVGIIGLVLILGLGILMFGPMFGLGGGDGGGHVPPAGVPNH